MDDESQVLRAAVAHEKEAALTRTHTAAVAAMGGKAEQLAVAVFPEVPEGDAQLLQEDGFGEVLVREVFVQEQVDHQQVEVPEGMQELIHLCLDGRVLCWHSTMSLGWRVNLGRMCAVYLQGGVKLNTRLLVELLYHIFIDPPGNIFLVNFQRSV